MTCAKTATALRSRRRSSSCLRYWSRRRGAPFTRLELLDRVFGVDYDGMERTVDVHIMNLRKKIESDPSAPEYVVTVAGLGYRFEGDNVA